MKCFLLFCLFSFLLPTMVVYAQVSSGAGVTMGDISSQLSSQGTFVKPTTKYRGSPYFSDNWLRGYLILDNNVRTKEMTFHYNMRYDRIEFEKMVNCFQYPIKN